MPGLFDQRGTPVKSNGNGELRSCFGRIPIGASGAVGTLVNLPGWTAVKNATGVYDVTFPACAECFVTFEVKSAARTVTKAYQKAKSATAGTLQFETTAPGGAAAEPASGDFIEVFFWGLRQAVL